MILLSGDTPVSALSVVISYTDFVKLLQGADDAAANKKQIELLTKRYEALHGLFSEAIEKIGDLNRKIEDLY